MQISYKHKRLEKVLIGVNVLACASVAATFAWRFGFDRPLLPVKILLAIQVALAGFFVVEKIIRLINSVCHRVRPGIEFLTVKYPVHQDFSNREGVVRPV